ncbi:DoxX family protein [Streptomyces sp. NPDC054841]
MGVLAVVAQVLTVLLGLGFAGGGAAKLAGVAVMRADAERFGLSYSMFRVVGALELSGGVCLVAGLVFSPLAVAAATGLVALMVGAVVCHRRAKDPVAKAVPAVVAGLLTVLAGVLSVIH